MSGTVAGTDLSTLDVDAQGMWLEGSILNFVTLPVDTILNAASLSGGANGEDAGRVNWLSNPDIVLEAYETYPGAHVQIALYDIVGAGLEVGDTIPVADASALDGPRPDDGSWQESFRELVDQWSATGEPLAVISIALDRTDQSSALPALYVDGAYHAAGGEFVISEAWSGIREITSLQSQAGGTLGTLAPVYFEADITVAGSAVTINADCVKNDAESDASGETGA